MFSENGLQSWAFDSTCPAGFGRLTFNADQHNNACYHLLQSRSPELPFAVWHDTETSGALPLLLPCVQRSLDIIRLDDDAAVGSAALRIGCRPQLACDGADEVAEARGQRLLLLNGQAALQPLQQEREVQLARLRGQRIACMQDCERRSEQGCNTERAPAVLRSPRCTPSAPR